MTLDQQKALSENRAYIADGDVQPVIYRCPVCDREADQHFVLEIRQCFICGGPNCQHDGSEVDHAESGCEQWICTECQEMQ